MFILLILLPLVNNILCDTSLDSSLPLVQLTWTADEGGEYDTSLCVYRTNAQTPDDLVTNTKWVEDYSYVADYSIDDTCFFAMSYTQVFGKEPSCPLACVNPKVLYTYSKEGFSPVHLKVCYTTKVKTSVEPVKRLRGVWQALSEYGGNSVSGPGRASWISYFYGGVCFMRHSGRLYSRPFDCSCLSDKDLNILSVTSSQVCVSAGIPASCHQLINARISERSLRLELSRLLAETARAFGRGDWPQCADEPRNRGYDWYDSKLAFRLMHANSSRCIPIDSYEVSVLTWFLSPVVAMVRDLFQSAVKILYSAAKSLMNTILQLASREAILLFSVVYLSTMYIFNSHVISAVSAVSCFVFFFVNLE